MTITNHKSLFFPIILVALGCHSQGSKTSSEKALDLNNRAVTLLNDFPDSALLLLDSALQFNPRLHTAHLNKVIIFCDKGLYLQAIEANKMALKEKPDLAESVTFLGMLYDKTGQPDKAKEQYQRAVQIFDDRLKKSNKHQEANKLNRLIALLLISEVEGQKELKKLLLDNPNDPTLKDLQIFDKMTFINQILTK